MMAIEDWLPPATVGLTFTGLGVAKLYGRARGIVGGGAKPWTQRMAGSCPTWSRPVNMLVPYVFLAAGLANLGWLAVLMLSR
jgi:hypothetical protein